MPSTATASRNTEVAASIAELEARLAEQLATAPDVPIRATLSADDLRVELWSCDIFILDGTPIEPRQSVADSLRTARLTFEQCGQLLLDSDRDCLPACLAKALVDHPDDPAAAWVAASMRMQAGYPEHGVVIERSGDAAFYFPAVGKSIAMLNVIGQHLRASSMRGGDAGRAARRGSADATAGATRAADAPLLASQLDGDKLYELLPMVERTVRRAALDQAFRDGRGGDADADADEAAQEFRWLKRDEMLKRLISLRHIDPSAAGDDDVRRKIDDVRYRRLKWARPPRCKPSAASAGAVAELAGKRQLSRPMTLRADTSGVEWCRNCYVIPQESGKAFCGACMKRHSASHLEGILAGDEDAEGGNLSPEVLEQARQQSLDRRRDLEQHAIAKAARRF
jgi:hypothetical protein